MGKSISDNVQKILACPYCLAPLNNSYQCESNENCQSHYKFSETGALDLRLQNKKPYNYDFTLGVPLPPESDLRFKVLPENNNPEVDFSGIDIPRHLTREIRSYFPKAKAENALMLDLGCGDMVHQKTCEYAGFEYLGMDYHSDQASILGDAHALPFKDNSFEFVISIAVLEHIKFPFIMMKEVNRVLKPNGVFIGTVAFLEPFHENSLYHHTHLGTYNSLKEGGFNIEGIYPNDKWSVLEAQATMGLFPKMPRLLSKLLILPIQILHKIWWKVGGLVSAKASEGARIRNTTGAFMFIAQKKDS